MDQVNLDQEDTYEVHYLFLYQQTKIVTEVCDPIIKDGLQKYVIYSFKGTDKSGSFEVQRRYNDFDVFRGYLVQRWPGCYIPPLPSKKPIGNMDQKFIDERKHYLDLFVKKLALYKHLWYSEEAELFKRNHADIEKALNNQHKQAIGDIIYKYEKSFPELSGKEINQDIITKINTTQLQLKKIQPLLENYQNQAKLITQTRTTNHENMLLFLDYLMPEYEKNCLAEYVVNPENKLVFYGVAQDELVLLKQQQEQDALDKVYLNVKIERREIDAMLEMYSQKDKFESHKASLQNKLRDYQKEKMDIEGGKTTLKSIFKQNKEEAALKLQVNIDTVSKEIEQCTVLCDMITIIIAYVEIPRFKTDKEQKYFHLLSSIAKNQIEKSKIQLEYWQALLKNQQLMEV